MNVQCKPAAKTWGLTSEIDNFFNSLLFGNESVPKKEQTRLAPTEVKKDEKGFTIYSEVPGFGKDELSVVYHKGYVTISAESKDEKKDSFFHRKTERSVYVGDKVNWDESSAEHKNGILTIKIPHREEVKKNIAIEIK